VCVAVTAVDLPTETRQLACILALYSIITFMAFTVEQQKHKTAAIQMIKAISDSVLYRTFLRQHKAVFLRDLSANFAPMCAGRQQTATVTQQRVSQSV